MTTTSLTSDEREQRLRDIRRARELGILPWSHLSSPTQQFEVARDAIDFLLSLIDSQAAGSDDERLDAMLKKSGILHTCHRPHDSGTALERLARNVSDLAATRMRDKCVEKVRARLVILEKQTAELKGDPLAHAGCSGRDSAIRDILNELESLTLDQVEQETK